MNLADNWTETLSYSNDEEEANSVEQDKADTKIEVLSMSYDDGAEYRDQNPHPAWNDTSCKQHRLNDFRNQ